MKWIMCLLFSFSAWASPDMELSRKYLDFYAHHLTNARSEILGLDDCRDTVPAKIENVKLEIDAGNKLFYGGDFELGVECLLNGKRQRITGQLLLEKTTEWTVVKSMTFSFREKKFNYQYLLAELGYFSHEDIASYQNP